ncbi:hypothetical protein GCM10029976_032370 [Kribbella albertanoniae]
MHLRLLELEAEIVQRIDWLATTAKLGRPLWYDAFASVVAGQPNSTREVRLREVVAYRERYGINSTSPFGREPTETQSHSAITTGDCP